MSLLDRIFKTPELRDLPPVLVDVGAAGGLNPIWRSIAKYSTGLGFEPDGRDIRKLNDASRTFARWIYCEGLVAPTLTDRNGREDFYLTKSPHCSSLLKPRNDKLQDWIFRDLFEVQKTVSVPALTLQSALVQNGIHRVDWLKCDTQGLDLGIYLSLPEEWRHRMLAVEFEPGLIDAYEGEYKFWSTLKAMDGEPFWICDMQAGMAVRGEAGVLRKQAGMPTLRWLDKLAPRAPAWVNVRYLRSVSAAQELIDRRGLLLSWVFSDILGQHTHSLMVANEGVRRFGDEFFLEMAAHSIRRLRRSMILNAPGWFMRRIGLKS